MRHPEAETEEVFLCNEKNGSKLDGPFFEKWPTKRAGRVAWDILDNYLPNHFPVFVKKSDIEKSGGFLPSSACMGDETFWR